jgi:hypothetical protein
MTKTLKIHFFSCPKESMADRTGRMEFLPSEGPAFGMGIT